MAKIKFVDKNRLKSLQLSKITPSTAQQSAAHSDERLTSYGQKTVQKQPKWPFWQFLVKNGRFWAITC
jgi:hypothetical protein